MYNKVYPDLQPRSKRRHRLRILVMVVFLYFLYCVWNEFLRIKYDPSFYAMLDVHYDTADPALLKRHFRQMSKKMHPDKAGPGSEEMYYKLRLAYETLLDPRRRWAYERFGPDMVNKTYTDYLQHYTREEFLLVVFYQRSGWWIMAIGIVSFLSSIISGSYILVSYTLPWFILEMTLKLYGQIQIPLILVFVLEVSFITIERGSLLNLAFLLGLLPYQFTIVARYTVLMAYMALVMVRFNLPRSNFGSRHSKAIRQVEDKLRVIKKQRLDFLVLDMEHICRELEVLAKKSEQC